jgi:hypothetical protein
MNQEEGEQVYKDIFVGWYKECGHPIKYRQYQTIQSTGVEPLSSRISLINSDLRRSLSKCVTLRETLSLCYKMTDKQFAEFRTKCTTNIIKLNEQ